MPQVKVYNQTGKINGEVELRPEIFDVKPRPGLIHSVVVALNANARRTISNTKTKGEIRGGGKKPWKQKGTGRARQGSIRSPQWVGGGIVFGPRKERNYSVKLNRKVKQQALFMALTDKVLGDHLIVLDSFKADEPKTKHVVSLLRALPVTRKTLIVVPSSNPELLRMVRNLQNVKLVTANSVGLLEVLGNQTVVFWRDALPVFEGLYHQA